MRVFVRRATSTCRGAAAHRRGAAGPRAGGLEWVHGGRGGLGLPWAILQHLPPALPGRSRRWSGSAPDGRALGRARNRVLSPPPRRTGAAAAPAQRRGAGPRRSQRGPGRRDLYTRPPLTLYLTSTVFEYPGPTGPSRSFVGPLVWDPPSQPPDWLESLRRPVALVTTSSGSRRRRPGDHRVGRAAGRGDGGRRHHAAGVLTGLDLPPNARVETYVPHPRPAEAAVTITRRDGHHAEVAGRGSAGRGHSVGSRPGRGSGGVRRPPEPPSTLLGASSPRRRCARRCVARGGLRPAAQAVAAGWPPRAEPRSRSIGSRHWSPAEPTDVRGGARHPAGSTRLGVSPPATGGRTGGCRRCGSSRPHRGCRSARPRRTRGLGARPRRRPTR